MSEVVSVFVYGTLLFPEVTSRLGVVSIDPETGNEVPVLRQPVSLLGYERFTVKLRDRGNFPAIVRSPDGVPGELLQCVTTESLVRLDQFEGVAEGYYTRNEVMVNVPGGGRAAAFAYVCGERLREHLAGPWDQAKFRDNDLAWYLTNVVTVGH